MLSTDSVKMWFVFNAVEQQHQFVEFAECATDNQSLMLHQRRTSNAACIRILRFVLAWYGIGALFTTVCGKKSTNCNSFPFIVQVTCTTSFEQKPLIFSYATKNAGLSIGFFITRVTKCLFFPWFGRHAQTCAQTSDTESPWQ